MCTDRQEPRASVVMHDAQDATHIQLSEVLAYLRVIEADMHAIREEIDAAKESVRKSKNPIVRSLFPWL